MSLNCSNTIVTNDKLCIDIDISNINSYNIENNNFVVTSTTSNGIIGDFKLPDFGLTQYDVGRTNSLTGETEFTFNDNKLTLYPMAFNDASGNTTNLGSFALNTGSSIGNYFELSGSYLNNFFKLEKYDYELMPNRFEKGFTFDMMLNINQNTFNSIYNISDGIYLFLGARAEDKYTYEYSGDTNYITSENHYLGPDFIYTVPCNSGNTNNPYIVPLSSITYTLSGSGTSGITNCVFLDYESNMSGNTIAFRLNNNKTMSYTRIDSNGKVKTSSSVNMIKTSGWTNIQISFQAYELIDNYDLLKDCYPVRQGDLKIYVNGSLFWKIENFEELWFKELSIDKERQLGVPYNISLGGGSFGLKHSYHFSQKFVTDISGNTVAIANTDYPYEMNLPFEQDLLIQKLYDGSFYGGIQTLRIYKENLTDEELKHNALIQSLKYGYKLSIGGRLIYR